uniref:CCHC-type domain-containing protein n=1 Tax=Tanacetum cinerariifolium TaxID=118510 RepID=A0A6L2LSC3_TANCI|nr:hypothetical protein [Tanacetum cinerariifolium]
MLTIRARRVIKRTSKNLDIYGQKIDFDMSKVECFNCHKNRHFARECRALKNQENRGREYGRKTVPMKNPTENALIAQDEIGGYDWSYQAEEEHPTNYAVMALTSSGSSSSLDSEKEYKEKGVIDSGFSRHMTGNKCYLTDYKDYDGGFVSFGDGKGRISRKGKIKTGTLDFDDVYFCKELKYNQFKAVNTACYVLNRSLVIKPHNKTPYELICRRHPLIDFMKPFGRPVTILNTRDYQGNFDEKMIRGFCRVLCGVAGFQSNGIAGTIDNIVAGQAKKKKEPEQEYIMIPICTTDPLISQGTKDSVVDVGKNATEIIIVGNKMHKAFPLLVKKFPLPEGTSHCMKKNANARRKVMPLPEDCTTVIIKKKLSVKDDSFLKISALCLALYSSSNRKCNIVQDMDQQYPTVTKTPMLDTGKFEQWQFQMQQYLQHEHYALWEAAILKTFGGNESTKKTKKNLLKQQYRNFRAEGSETLEQTFTRLQLIIGQLQFMGVEVEQDDLNQKFITSLAPEWLMHTIVWRNRSDLDTMSLDDLYNHLKHSRGNDEVNTASVYTASSNVPTTSANVATVSISQETACTYIDSQSSGSQIKFEDINQINEYDMEEMDIKWNMALMSMRADKFWKKTGKKISIQGSDVAGFDKSKVECFNCHKMVNFARECRAPKNQERGRRDTYRQGSKAKEQTPKALMAIDGVGYNAVPPPYTGNFLPPKPDLSGLEEFENEPIVTEPTVKKPAVKISEAKASADKPKEERKNFSPPLIEDWISDSEDEAKKNKVNVVGAKTNNELPFDLEMPTLEDISTFNFSSDHEDDVEKADINNIDITIQFSPTLTTRIHKDHPLDQVIGDLHSTTQTRNMSKNLEDHGFVTTIHQRTNHKDLQNYLFACFYHKKNPKEGIDYDEVFTPVARIEAIRLFLAYASFKDFVVYQMDIKSAFLYGKIKEEVYICQPPGFEDPDFLDKVYKVKKTLYRLHQAPRAWHKDDILLVQVYVDDIIFGLQVKQKQDRIFISEDKYVAEILRKYGFSEVKNASTPMETQKPLLKDEDGEEVDVHMYRLMIGSLMYLTSLRLDIIFAHDTDSDYAGASLDRKSTTEGCQFLRCRLISWQCKKQTVVANSITEAKYMAASSCCGQVLWIQNQLLDYGIEAIRLFLAYASFKDFVVYQMDIKSAFLYGKIKEEVYICQPPGFEDPDFLDKVYKVKKTLYRLHQAPRAWHKDDILLVQVYVDDIIFGLQVKQKQDRIFISEDKYVAEILRKYGFSEVKNASTPMETQKPLLKDEDGEEVDVHMYRLMIGSLMYLTSLRLDIIFAHDTDSDYAGASLDRKSTTEGCQFLRCRLISWQCKKQTVVANSITEAKILKPWCDSQVNVNNNLSKPVTTHYFPKEREAASAKPYHMIASSNSRNSSKNMPRFSSNDMVYNHYLEEAKKKTHERSRNSETSLMPFARSQRTANGSKPKPRSNTQTFRNWPASKNSFVTTKTVPIAEHSRNSRNFSDSKHYVCSTCQQCVFSANHDSC